MDIWPTVAVTEEPPSPLFSFPRISYKLSPFVLAAILLEGERTRYQAKVLRLPCTHPLVQPQRQSYCGIIMLRFPRLHVVCRVGESK